MRIASLPSKTYIMNIKVKTFGFVFWIILVTLPTLIFAQNFDEYVKQQQAKFSAHTDRVNREFDEHRQRMNAEYAEMMRKAWQKTDLREALPAPKPPEPTKPTVKPENSTTPTMRVQPAKVVELPRYEMPMPERPIAPPPAISKPNFAFMFHNTKCKVSLADDIKISLADAYEQSASAAWSAMSEKGYDMLAGECLSERERLELNDWGYIELVKVLAEKFLGKGNGATIMQAYILVQSGYKVRLARCGTRLALLVPFANQIYGRQYIEIDGEKFYDIYGSGSGTYYVFNRSFSGEKTASTSITHEPQLEYQPSDEKTFGARRYPNLKVNLQTNKNLIDFYSSFPVTDNWSGYIGASLSQKVKDKLYPALKEQMKGRNSMGCVTLLLNFVQTAFQYKSDWDQFGCEKPFFGDELFYYPYCDCEDRSILFYILVKELVDVDVVLLDYPDHIATAVCLSEEYDIKGCYFMVGGKKYYICDPTYIGASIGDCMQQYINTAPNIIRISK